MKYKYKWDVDKNEINISKHGISFQEVIEIFNDKNIKFIYDNNRFIYEERYKVY